MAGMIEVGKATITIIPNMQGAQQAISAQMGAAAAGAGKTASAVSTDLATGSIGIRTG